MTINSYLKANKKRLKDVIIYDYDTDKKYIIDPTNKVYIFNGERVKRKNVINYLKRLFILCEYNQGGAIFLQVNY